MLTEIFPVARQFGEPFIGQTSLEKLGKAAVFTLYESMYCTVKSCATVTCRQRRVVVVVCVKNNRLNSRQGETHVDLGLLRCAGGRPSDLELQWKEIGNTACGRDAITVVGSLVQRWRRSDRGWRACGLSEHNPNAAGGRQQPEQIMHGGANRRYALGRDAACLVCE